MHLHQLHEFTTWQHKNKNSQLLLRPQDFASLFTFSKRKYGLKKVARMREVRHFFDMTRVRRITTMSRRGWSKKDWRILHDYVSRVVVRRTYVWVRHIQVERGGGGGCQREVVFLDCKMVFLFLNSSVSSWAPIETRHPLLLRSWHYEDNEVGQFFSSSLTFFSYSYSKTHFLKPHFPQQHSVLITMETFSYLV